MSNVVNMAQEASKYPSRREILATLRDNQEVIDQVMQIVSVIHQENMLLINRLENGK